MKIYFVAFADTKFIKTLDRIGKEAVESKFFDVVETLSEKDLDQTFLERNGNFIKNNPRGYGYWIWKPQVCLQTFRKMNEDDILVYCDAGCHINSNGKQRFSEYIEMAKQNGSVNFEMHHIESHWTKKDCFDHLEVNQFANTGQIMATIFMLKKNEINVKLVEEWLRLCENYHLVNDEPSVNSNYPSFREHRHDQSLFSLLRKKVGFKTIPDETYSSNWLIIQHIPFQARRIKF